MANFGLFLKVSPRIDWNKRHGKFLIEDLLEEFIAPLETILSDTRSITYSIRFASAFKGETTLTDVLIDIFDSIDAKKLTPQVHSFLLGVALDECIKPINKLNFCDWSMAATALCGWTPDFDLHAFCLARHKDLKCLLSKEVAPDDEDKTKADSKPSRTEEALNSWFTVPDWSEKMFVESGVKLLSAVATSWEEDRQGFAAGAFAEFSSLILSRLERKLQVNRLERQQETRVFNGQPSDDERVKELMALDHWLLKLKELLEQERAFLKVDFAQIQFI
jgi:hypothetical protein